MPQEPKKKHSKARKRTRRASIILKSLGVLKCSNCGESMLPHLVCRSCGFYAGKKITEGRTKITKA